MTKKLINRPVYINKLLAFKDADVIKIITGIRRCGKSTLFSLYIDELRKKGIRQNQIQFIKLEEIENEKFLDYRELYRHITANLTEGRNYVFLDEIQNVPDFQKAVRSLFEKGNIDIYLTGSNSQLQSGQWATSIAGRYVEIKMFPLSFAEFVSSYGNKYSLDKIYSDYIAGSSFPYAVNIMSQNDSGIALNSYLEGIYNTILLKDIIENRKFSSEGRLNRVIRFIADSIGSEISVKKISDTMTSDGVKMQPATVEGYIDALMDSYVIYKAERYDVKGKRILKTLNKYYIADIGIRKFLLGNKGADQGHILENIVYLELLRRSRKVYIGKVRHNNKDVEIDFIAETAEGIEYYQVADTVNGDETLVRELTPFKSLKDNYPKFILTRDYGRIDHNGIKQVNVLEWLAE
ncbi:MAG: ATP-binding protein [Elusimicrobiales bacterium]|nr:ATP-binding protein [Elusimicrobiales bacterium]